MADAPSRALVIFGDGLMAHVTEQHSNLHSLASDGCCGFLALRSSCSTGELGNLIQLLDQENAVFQPLAERFMGMKAAMVTNSEAAAVIGHKAGFTVSLLHRDFESEAVKSGEVIASRFVDMIGACDKHDQKDTANKFDLLFLHIVGDDRPGDMSCAAAADWINAMVGKLKSIAAEHLLLVLVLGYGDKPVQKMLQGDDMTSDRLLGLRPRQSYSIKEGKPVDVSDDHTLLAVYHQDAVTRRDHCKRLSLEEFREECGNLTILADRFLHEVAFKLWKAPKYGA